MSDTEKKAKKPKLIWLYFLFLILPAILWFVTREHYTDEMLSAVDDKLLNHELSWAGRGRDYAQYTVTCEGQERSYKVLYRIPASTAKAPALVIVHMIDSTEAVFDLMNNAENAKDCAIAAINVKEYFALDEKGRIKTKNVVLGRGLVDGLHAVDLAIEFVQGHRIVDTSAIYLVGIGEAALLALPAADNYSSSLKGVACIDADAMMSLKDWDSKDFASPIGWAGKMSSLKAMLVSTGGTSAESGMASFANSFASVDRIQSSSQNVQEKYSVALGSTIQWVWKDRPRIPDKTTVPKPPSSDNSVVIRK